MRRYILLFCILLLASCALFRDLSILKQTEIVSQNTYAIKESAETGRYDLVDFYTKALTRLIVSPETSLSVSPIIDKDGRYVVTLPSRFTNQRILVVGSEEYQKLIQTQAIAKQLLEENIKLIKNTSDIDNAVREQAEALDSLYYENEKYKTQTKLQSENLSKKNIIILSLSILIIGYLYAKIGLKMPFI
jgi:hypothetical protein